MYVGILKFIKPVKDFKKYLSYFEKLIIAVDSINKIEFQRKFCTNLKYLCMYLFRAKLSCRKFRVDFLEFSNEIHDIGSIIIHPKYSHLRPHDYDVAILKASPWGLSKEIKPIKVSEIEPSPGDIVQLSGFGKLYVRIFNFDCKKLPLSKFVKNKKKTHEQIFCYSQLVVPAQPFGLSG